MLTILRVHISHIKPFRNIVIEVKVWFILQTNHHPKPIPPLMILYLLPKRLLQIVKLQLSMLLRNLTHTQWALRYTGVLLLKFEVFGELHQLLTLFHGLALPNHSDVGISGHGFDMSKFVAQ